MHYRKSKMSRRAVAAMLAFLTAATPISYVRAYADEEVSVADEAENEVESLILPYEAQTGSEEESFSEVTEDSAITAEGAEETVSMPQEETESSTESAETAGTLESLTDESVSQEQTGTEPLAETAQEPETETTAEEVDDGQESVSAEESTAETTETTETAEAETIAESFDLDAASREDIQKHIELIGGSDSDAYYEWIGSLDEDHYILVWIARFGNGTDVLYDTYGFDFDGMSDGEAAEYLAGLDEYDYEDIKNEMTFAQFKRYVAIKGLVEAAKLAKEETTAEQKEEAAAGDVGAPEGDEDTAGGYDNAISLADSGSYTEISQPAFIQTLLSKVGKGYSQALRYEANYYDCSSLVLRCLQEYGLSGVPYTTSGWNSLLSGKKVGDIITFAGNGKKATYRLAAVNTNVIANPDVFTVPGTLMVLIEQSESSGHIAVSLGSFDRQNGGYNPATQANEIINLTRDYVAGVLASRYSVSKDLLMGNNSISSYSNTWMHSSYCGWDMKIGSAYSGQYNRIWRVEAYNPSTGVCVTNAPNGTHGLNAKYVLVPVEDSSEKLSIDKINVSDVSISGYRVSVSLSSSAGIKEVLMPTWTERNGQDDIVWHKASVSGNTATFYIPTSAHKNETGKYITHVYAYSNSGLYKIDGTSVTVPAKATVLKINSAAASEVSASGYRVTVNFTAEAGVKEVLMPTWTSKNGQDDIVWHKAGVSGNTATFYIPVSAHKNESGTYTTHVYVRDNEGKEVITGLEVKVLAASKPEIKNVQVSEVSASGYRVTAAFTADAGVKEVLMPTWTSSNGQDDLVWHVASVSGNTATFYVPVSAHKNESGAYTTHVYVRDNAGNEVIKGTSVNVPSSKPEIKSVQVSEVSSAGYRVTATISAPAGVKEVLMPTWTSSNGQDDIVWHVASVSGNTATFYIPVSAHKNESGAYTTHVYLRDKNGNQVITGVNAAVPASNLPTISNVTISDLSSSGYRVTVTFSAPAGVKEVLMPTWTSSNGQDDIVWHKASVSGNAATLYISRSAHRNEGGTYITHVYVYDKNGKFALRGTGATLK